MSSSRSPTHGHHPPENGSSPVTRPSYMPPPRKAAQPTKRFPLVAAVAVATCIGVPAIAYLHTASGEATGPHERATAAPTAGQAKAVPPAQTVGVVHVTSNPIGAEVFIDDEPVGMTPLSLPMPPGDYTLLLKNRATTRVVPVTVEANATVEPFVDLMPSLASSGRVEITSEPAGAKVTVDGSSRGVTPLVLAALPAGQHHIVVTDGSVTVTRVIDVRAGTVVNVSASMVPRTSSARGWVSIQAPFELQVFEGTRLLGTSHTDRFPLSAGTHTLDVQAPAYGYQGQVAVDVAPGETTMVPIVMPNGSLSITATPSAEVWLDGERIGQTPLDDIEVAIGEHDLTWRHSDLGERSQKVYVSIGAPATAAVNFTNLPAVTRSRP